LDFLAILICFGIVFGFCNLWVKANPSAKVQFTANAIIDLTGLDTTLYALSGSECDSLTVSGPTLSVDIPSGSSFTLGTASQNVLRLTPSGGKVTLTFSSNYFSSGYVSQWTASSLIADTKVNFLVGVPERNADYLIKVDGQKLAYFRSSDTKEVSFTYSGGFSSKIFEILREDQPTTGDGGMPAQWFNPPKPPVGGFRILINNDAKYTDSIIVNLTLVGGPDTKRMAISNFPDFRDASQKTYQTTKIWNLCQGLTSCPDGKYTVYAKFYTDWGTASEVISDSIIYKKGIILPEAKEKPIEEMTVEEILTKMIEILTKLIQLYTELIQILKG